MLSPLLNLGKIISSEAVTHAQGWHQLAPKKKDDVEINKPDGDEIKKYQEALKEQEQHLVNQQNQLTQQSKKFLDSKEKLKFPLDIADGISRIPFIRYKPYKYEAIGKLNEGKAGASIYLPMTASVTQNTNPNWAQETDILSRFTSSDPTKVEGAGEGIEGLIGAAGKAGIVGGLGKLVASVTGALGGTDISKASMRRFGASFNPFNERFFDGVSFRVYSFEHKFLPSSGKEALEVSNIIKRFQYFSLPDLAFQRAFLTYPSLWRIGFFTADSERNMFLPILEDCVMTLVGVVFGSGGTWAELAAGEPVEVTLSLQATETTIPTKTRMLNEQSKTIANTKASEKRNRLDYGRLVDIEQPREAGYMPASDR